MITKIYHKKNKQFQIEFYQDEKCQQAFNFENIKNLYIELKDGDCTPIFSLSNKLWSLNIKANIFTPIWYLGLYDGISPQTPLITLDDILDNITIEGKNNAVLFLSEEEADRHSDNCEAWFLYQKDFPTRQFNSEMDIRDWKVITIFLAHGTESEIEKANKIAHELKKKYGIKEVNLFVLHCWDYYEYRGEPIAFDIYGYAIQWEPYRVPPHSIIYELEISKVITTNSTGILEISEQVIDCYNLFNDYLKGK